MSPTAEQLERLNRLSPEQRARLVAVLRQDPSRTQDDTVVQRPTPTQPAQLSYAQRQLWFVDQLNRGSSSYNLPVALKLDGPLDVDALEQALRQVVGRHESLRTTFSAPDGQPVQVIAPDCWLRLPVGNLQAWPAHTRERAAARLVRAIARRPFDLERGPLVRARLLRLGPEEHWLVLVVHHIVIDGWSLGVLFRELEALYSTARTGAPADLPPLPIQYADYAHWQRQQLQGATRDRLLAYWRQHLADAPTALDLPTDHPRPAVLSTRGTTLPIQVSVEVRRTLERLAREEGATLYMALLAGLGALLERVTGRDDVLIGSPVANRPRVEMENLIGCFVNTLPLRVRPGQADTFRALLRQVRTTTLGALAHQELPLQQVVEDLQPPRDLGRHPLVQVLFGLQNAPMELPVLPGLIVHNLDIETVASPFDLSVLLEETHDGLSGVVEYSTELFQSTTIERLMGHFGTLLAAATAEPDAPLARLPLLTPVEQRQILVEWNATGHSAGERVCIHELIARRAATAPDAVAIDGRSGTLSYAELDRRANNMAHHLRTLGVGPEDVVALCLERSPDLVVAMLGILKAGGAYLPLDPAFPSDRLAFMVADARAALVLTQRHLAGRVALDGVRQVLVDELAEVPAPPAPSPTVEPDNLAYVIYTSGSTGRPKGVQVTHGSLVNHALAIAQAYALGSADRVLQFAAMGFDVLAEEVYPTLISGAAVIFGAAGVVPAFDELQQLIELDRISVVNLPASYWNAWVAELARCRVLPPAVLRLVVTGSDRVLAERLALWRAQVGARIRWLNGYGPTEATITSTLYEPSGAIEHATSGTVPIGRPISGAAVYVLGPDLAPVPVGVAGELFIGGAGLARGYLGRPELTADRFIPNPFASSPGQRLYRTGDRARWRADGQLEFLGRLDRQVKLRGFRIELGEIEAALAALPALREAVVLVREDTPGQSRLVGYVVPRSDPPPSMSELRLELGRQLPDYMVPSAFVVLSALPLTPNGKIDRQALPAPQQMPSSAAAAEPAATETERAIAAIWADVLGLPNVDRHTSFFDLGGHSLQLLQVHSRLRERFEAELTVVDLFKHPTVSALAQRVRDPEQEARSNQAGRDRAATRRALLGRLRDKRG